MGADPHGRAGSISQIEPAHMADLVQSSRLNLVQCPRLNQVQSALSNWPIFYNPATSTGDFFCVCVCVMCVTKTASYWG